MLKDNAANHIANLDNIMKALRHDANVLMKMGSAPSRLVIMNALEGLKERLMGTSAPAQAAPYENLKSTFALMAHLGSASSILSKADEVGHHQFTPEEQSAQAQTLAMLSHMLISDPVIGTWLDAAEKDVAKMGPEDQRNLSLMRRAWIKETCLPQNLVNDMARLGSEGSQKHANNYRSNDWSTMRDWYEFSFNTMRAVGAAQKEKLGSASVYDALLDSFNPGMNAAHIEAEFKKLGEALKPLIAQALEKQKNEPAPIPLKGPFPKAQQQELCDRIIKAQGFDIDKGRLDIIIGHPSSGGSSDDSRITTRYEEDDFLEALGTTTHEAGHAMYDQNTPTHLRHQPAGSSYGMAVHESQSMIMERCACKSPESFQFLEREARDVFGRPDDPALNADNLRRLMMKVQPSFIRVNADELTYPAHVVLRFELEKGLIEGSLKIDDLPKAWSDGMERLIGIRPSGPAEGWMQDVHWPSGAIGYFPAYTLGAMGAAQFYAAACRQHPEIPSEIAKGNFKPLAGWLKTNVHGKGSLLDMDELFIQATGEKLNAKYFIAYLRERFLGKPEHGFSPAPAPH